MVMRLFAVVLLVFLITSCSDKKAESDVVTFDTLLTMRQEKDEFFTDDSGSPIPEELRADFKGLHYFDPDSAYIAIASFEPAVAGDTFLMQTTTDNVRNVIRAGVFVFTINGEEGRLAAYQFVDSEHSSYFVPFKDATNRKETYPTGRYLDIAMRDDQLYVLDFNMAYNPYCAYNDNYSCPLVPAENELPFPINAGERLWK